ncbi:MAG TPA: sigma-70 family RNA polymerase sigma factor [Polyangiaceae bacterium]
MKLTKKKPSSPSKEIVDARSSFFQELRELPTLTREQEIELARRIERGEHRLREAIASSHFARKELAALGIVIHDESAGSDAAREELSPKNVTRLLDRLDAVGGRAAKTAEAVRRARDEAERARAELVRSNMRLVVWMAKRQANHGLPLLDLIQEGNLGLMRAAEKFDHHRGVRFNTYAVWWIRQAINRALSNQARTIRMPVHLVESNRKVAKMLQRFALEHGREATIEEAAADTGLPLAKVRELWDAPIQPVSMDAPVGAESDTKLGDMMPDRSVDSPVEAISNERLPAQMDKLLQTLTERERQVLKMRFGIDGPDERTLQEIGSTFALSRERIRQIEAQALEKLRTLAEREELDSHLAS